MPKPPKPTKAIEYVLAASRRTDEDTGAVTTRLEIRTTREFQSFQYVIAVDAEFDDAGKSITLRIGGVSVPADLMPGAGPAIGAFEIAGLKNGTYAVIVKKAPKDVNTFSMKLTATRVALDDATASGRVFVTAESLRTS